MNSRAAETSPAFKTRLLKSIMHLCWWRKSAPRMHSCVNSPATRNEYYTFNLATSTIRLVCPKIFRAPPLAATTCGTAVSNWDSVVAVHSLQISWCRMETADPESTSILARRPPIKPSTTRVELLVAAFSMVPCRLPLPRPRDVGQFLLTCPDLPQFQQDP